MIRLLFAFLFMTGLSHSAIAQTCNRNLALGKPVTTSSVTAGNIATRATDGDPTSRWESAWSDPQWIQIDLGQNYDLCTINLTWQVLATGYTLEVSTNGTSWTTVATETANTGLTKSYPITANARYVRMMGNTRGSAYGYSLYEFEVIGTEPDYYCSNTNVAYMRPTTTSSVANGNPGNQAVDGNPGSRWESQGSDPQFIYVDLGAEYDLCRVVLNWEAAYGKDYTIDISSNGATWTTVKTVTGNYILNNTIPVSGKARYVRMSGTARGSVYGYSLWEFAVYAILPAVSITKIADATEGGTGSYRVSLPAGITFSEPITVNYTVSGTAISGTDYTAASVPGSVIIPANTNSIDVNFNTLQDLIIEGDETAVLTLSNAASPSYTGFPVSSTDPSATITISDDDNIAANQVIGIMKNADAAEPATDGSFTVSLPAGYTSSRPVTVNYAVTGTATSGADYPVLPATVTIPAGQNAFTFPLQVTDDKVLEIPETVIVNVTGGNAPVVGAFTASAFNGSATLTITDDDNIAANKIISISKTTDAAEPSSNGSFSIALPTGVTVFEDVTVNYTVAGTASMGTDYATLSGSIIIPANQNSVALNVNVINDAAIEPAETVATTLTSGGSNTFGTFTVSAINGAASLDILDDDDIPANKVINVSSVSNATENGSDGTFSFSLPAGVSYPEAITVTFTIAGTATIGTDYTTIPLTVTIPANQNSVTLNITAIDDAIAEGDETIIATITGGSSMSFGAFTPGTANTATMTLVDDETLATNKTISIANANDGTEGATNGAFTVSLPTGTTATQPVTVTYTVAGTATSGTDYTALTGTVIIPAGQNNATITLPVADDQVIENDETVIVTVTGGNAPVLGAFTPDAVAASATVIIFDNETGPAARAISIANTSNGTEPATNGSFTISLPAGVTSAQAITVNYTIAGTATPGTDYTSLTGTTTILANQNSVLLPLNVINDNIIENSETVVVTITGGNSTIPGTFPASTTNATATVNIGDDDNIAANRVISIVTLNDGAEPASNGNFTISLPTGITAAENVTVIYNIAGTAINGTDYATINGIATIPAGQNNINLSIDVINDDIIELSESVSVSVSNGTTPTMGSFTASLGSASATLQIVDNDNDAAHKEISITNLSDATEPAANGSLRISLPTGVTVNEPVTVTYTIAGTATAGVDYTTLTGTATIPANQNNVLLPVNIINDQILEAGETVIVTITGGSSATFIPFTPSTASPSATVIINDDDNTVANKQISIAQVSDASEPATNGSFRISLPAGVTVNEPVTVNYTIAGTATAGADYTTLTGTTTIQANQNNILLPVDVINDQILEAGETVIVTITGGTSATFTPFTASAGSPSATVIINDDDNTIANKQISITRVSDAAEPTTGGGFRVSLPSGITVAENISVAYTIAGSATAGADYTTLTGTIPIPANQNNVILSVAVTDDQIIENIEKVIVAITGGTSATFGAFTANASFTTDSIVINDNDNIPGNKLITIAKLNDGNETPLDGNFTINLPAGITASQDITVSYTVTGTATSGADYTALSGTVPIRAGQNSITLPVVVTNDQVIENTETVTVAITSGATAALGTFTASASNGSATVNIDDNDNTPANRTINIANANDGTEPGINGNFTISLPTGITASQDVTVSYTVTGTATPGTDYTALSGTVIIPANQNSVALAVPVTDDLLMEGDETVVVRLTGGTSTLGSFTPGTATATVIIGDNESIPANKIIRITKTTDAAEPGVPGTYTISLPNGVTATQDIVVSYTIGGTATSGTDYAPLTGTITIPAGQNSVTLTVNITDDKVIEGNETIIATVTGGTGNNLGAFTPDPANTSATISISDDEYTTANMIISITAMNNAAEPSTAGNFSISLPTGVTAKEDIVVNYIASGTTTEGQDYNALTHSIIIPAGQNSFTLPITVIDDTNIEGAETVTITINTATAATLGAFTVSAPSGQATNTISDDDAIADQFETWKTASMFNIDADGKVGPNEEITYTISVRNTGTNVINQLTVEDPIPDNTTYLSGGTLNGNNVTFTINNLQPGAIEEVSFVVMTAADLSGVLYISNIAQVSDGTNTHSTLACDPSDPTCEGGIGTLTPVRETMGNLSITKTLMAPPTINGQYYAIGEMIAYSITVSNQGDKTFNNIVITDSLPRSLDMPAYYVTTKGAIVASPASRKVICAVEQMLPGETVTITIQCRINDKNIVNTAYVTTTDTELDPTDNTAISTASASIHDLAFINAFRPGNTSTNNKFVIVGLEKYPGAKLLVYDRWGTLVYHSDDYRNNWRAEELSNGVYIYTLEVKKPEGRVVYKGSVTIIR